MGTPDRAVLANLGGALPLPRRCYYNYRSLTYRHKNQTVSQELIKNASDIDLQQKAIELKKTAIEEFKLEHTQVQEAAIQFGFFLKRYAIEPYNDATEKMKIKSGGKKEPVEMLQKYRAEHLEKVQAMTKAIERGDADSVLDDQGVRQLVDSLYGLPYFGEDLKRIVRTNEKAAEATFRGMASHGALDPKVDAVPRRSTGEQQDRFQRVLVCQVGDRL
ncbi:hypothetical protein C8A00DRAFT_35238 [Chaetomidium leptoderma]|uniref:Uncharacterized protein n=1 Tax=Chaetomidium leptoderma TaxID=669021 RepID=A0AAN6VIW2_9PEZI|nr:hypothetical protein C8A00DRAFT_35238 [Chaetomidium leptoderma]